MTASMNKKNKNKTPVRDSVRKRRRKRKRNAVVFVTVLLFVLTLGGIFLAVLAAEKASGMPETEVSTGIETKQERDAETQTGTKPTESGEEGLLFEIKSQNLEWEEEEKKQEEPIGRYDALLQDEEAMREQRIYAKQAASPDEIVFAFAGDILFDPNYAMMASLIRRGGAVEEAFSTELLSAMRGADIFLVNNEFPYTNRGEPLPGKQFTFRAEPERAEYLIEMGADIVSLANNHAYDYGEISLLDTLDTLTKMDMPYVGAGRDLEEASSPVSFLINDRKIAVLAATQIERNDNPDTKGAAENSAGTFRCWNVENLLAAVKAAKEENDYVIVYIHWGTENQAQTDWAQDEQAVKIAEAGADVIIGAHSHCLQPVGYVKGVPVVYSLGNFWFNSRTLDTVLARVIITKKGEEEHLAVQLLPAKQEDCRTRLLDGAEKQRVLTYLNDISSGAYLDQDGFLLQENT